MTARQLESWRRAGLLPRHRRRGLGRGRGSVVDAVDPLVVESAAALARHLRQGRDRRLAVLEWFAEAGTLPVEPEAVRVPEPPIGTVRQALVWVLERSVAQRLTELARSAAGTGEEGRDALYAAAGRIPGPYRPVAHPALVRAALETGKDLPAEAEGPDLRSVVHLVAAIGLGGQEVGADALAEAFTGFNLHGLTVEDWQQRLSAAERGKGPPVNWALFERYADAVGPIKRASDEELVRARTVLVGLRGFSCMYLLHGLCLPETPAQAALRQRIDDLGVFPLLDLVIVADPSPGQFALGLTVCLQPFYDNLYETLTQQLTVNTDIFSIPSDETGPAGFSEAWIRTLREPANAAPQDGGGADSGPGERPG